MRKKSMMSLFMIAIIGIILAIYLFWGSSGTTVGEYGKEESVYVRVDKMYEKKISNQNNAPDTYLLNLTIFDKSGDSLGYEVVKNIDNYFQGKTNSGDFNLEIQEHKYYEFVLRGRRNSRMSEFRNIMEHTTWKRPQR